MANAAILLFGKDPKHFFMQSEIKCIALPTTELKKPHPSIPCNPTLFRGFYRVAYVEDVGGGTLDIIKRCRDVNLPDPEFEEKMGFFVVTFWRSIVTKEYLVVTKEYLEKIGINERQHKAIKYIKQKGRIGRSEYVELCGCSPKTAYNDIQDIVKKDILIASGKGKRTYYMLRGIHIKAEDV